MVEDNSHAGQGSVLLDIGGDVGALIVEMPARLDGFEIEIRPVGAGLDRSHSHAEEHVHRTEHGHTHSHAAEHGHLPHVAVLPRPTPEGVVHSAVFGELAAGEYELYIRPDGPVELTATVVGAGVVFATWPQH